jgi:predicted transcriptional regulator
MMTMKKNINGKKQRDESAAIIADSLGISADLVRKVLRGDRESRSNRQIMDLYKYYQKGKKQLIKEIQEKAKEYKKWS